MSMVAARRVPGCVAFGRRA